MLRFMKNKILIPLFILGALAAFFSFRYSGGNDVTEQKEGLIIKTVMRAIREGHYAPREINDSFSAKVYHKLLDEMDPDKKLLTQKDINELKSYEFKIDDEINNGTLEFYRLLNEKLSTGIDNADTFCKEILKTPFSFKSDEQIQLNGDKLEYAADENALKDRWRQYLKYRVLVKYEELKKDRDENKKDDKAKADKKAEKKKTDTELEADARTAIKKSMDYYFKRQHKLKEDTRFSIYVNAITNNEDPHTDYFPPADKARFDEMMSGSFYGIGAQLREEDGKIKIMEILPGTPCWKQGELKAGDEILKVAQGDSTPVDVQGYEIDDAVKIIRGPKGTEVRLTVKHLDGATKVIPIIRGEVQKEETFAKSAIIQGDNGPVGYIYLPEFYSDFNKISGRRCAEDVALEIQKLKAANVTGIILDLRYNGGGSLSDVVDMGGLFIDQGPIVQVKNSGTAAMTLRDANKGIFYDGPLAIMVNEGSASASEILAAAMQDYKRAVIVGAPTYGKGTVQKIIPLDDFADPLTRAKFSSDQNEVADGRKPASNNALSYSGLGSLKITIQKFYRINGGSTQLKGVTPDISLPSTYDDIDIGERSNKAALKWDEIAPASYQVYPRALNTAALAADSKKRIASNPTFTLIQQNAARLKKLQDDNMVSLNETAFKKESEEANAISKQIEDAQKKTTPFAITNPKEDMEKINLDSTNVRKNMDWIKNLKKDIYLAETVNIVNDISKQYMKVNMGTGMK
ncbi:MAG: hypothetical protein BGO69_05050 [Bacteroidetes bacterium 46-16]|nr:MAG: hypothetical protein BGO69_05050 [Bacteroidetes bacterium 46-16]